MKSMKHIIQLMIASMLIVSTTYAQSGSIQVNVTGASSSKGSVVIGLYNSAEGFSESDKSFKGGTVAASTTSVTYTFKNIPDGIYGIAVWHDEDDNKELNTNFIGIPKEKYGFSNNASGSFGPPDFSETTFQVTNGKMTSVEIKMD